VHACDAGTAPTLRRAPAHGAQPLTARGEQMTFHWGLHDEVLFAGWVACTPARYAASLLAVAGAALGVSLVKALRTRAEQRLGGARSAARGLLDDEGGDAMQLGAGQGEGSQVAGAPAAGAGRLLVCRATLRDNVVRAGFVGASRAALPVLTGHAAFLAPY
jgi:hypothetical protein